MKKNINKKKQALNISKKLTPKESFFLLDSIQNEKLFFFYKNFYQKKPTNFLYESIFEKISLKIEFFAFLHIFQQFYSKTKKKHIKKIQKKKFNQKVPFAPRGSFFDLYKKNPFLEEKKTKKKFRIEKKKKPTLFHQANFFFKAIEPVQSKLQKKSFLDLCTTGQSFLFHGFSYKIEMEKALSFFVGNTFRIHWIRGNSMGGTSQYLLDIILFFFKKRIPYRRLCSILFQELRNLSYIEGIRITYAGRLGGKTNKAVRSKKETKKIGKPSLHIFSAKIDFVQGEVETKFGMVGIKIWIRYK